MNSKGTVCSIGQFSVRSYLVHDVVVTAVLVAGREVFKYIDVGAIKPS